MGDVIDFKTRRHKAEAASAQARKAALPADSAIGRSTQSASAPPPLPSTRLQAFPSLCAPGSGHTGWSAHIMERYILGHDTSRLLKNAC